MFTAQPTSPPLITYLARSESHCFLFMLGLEEVEMIRCVFYEILEPAQPIELSRSEYTESLR